MPASSSPKASTGDVSEYTRLHISPLDPELLKVALPASVAPHARNVSYHSIETFPEKRYGFVDLPAMDAEKLKKKLHNSVLKGNKLRVEKARPEKQVEVPNEELDKAYEEEEERKQKRKAKKYADVGEGSKKRKRNREVVEGVVLTDRKVKRGWTEPADQRRKKSKKDKESDKEGKTTEKKKRLKSKYTDQDECLLKTTLPANAVANATGDNVPKKRKKRSNTREVTVHEFEKTTRFPSFLKTSAPESQSKPATEFVEGKGWVDEDGEVVEAARARPPPKPAAQKPKKSKVVKEVVVTPGNDDSTSSSTSSSGTSSDEESEEESEKEEAIEKDDESVSGYDGTPAQPEHTTPVSAIKGDTARPMSSSSSRSLTIKIPPPLTPSATKIHPLEALYKRPKPDGDGAETPAAKQAEPFSFFDAEDEEEPEADRRNPPMTPFSRQDFEWRSTRSAAPTPDTAHPTRMRNFWNSQGDDDDAEMDDDVDGLDGVMDGEDGQGGDGAPAAGSTEFQSWFWENRRDLNRSWMNRRKMAAKEKRHRDNKARASKAV
ncbi:hypothetical protein QQZ08_010611 [Neonectria magnoliae]|uniref:Nucleotide-binding, alpha-beta plait n=1 Tax=Neonectria magnoliae TaxID=2732573 RepID=A0ABR1HGK8_9HYPO